jgi:hypothetical protein
MTDRHITLKFRSLLLSAAVGGLLLVASEPGRAAAPPLHSFPSVQTDAVGKTLEASFVWTTPSLSGGAVAFRKSFDLEAKPSQAVLHLFADARYILWVNGTYVDRGPNRFQPNGPEYDSLNIASRLKQGSNSIAILVIGNLSGGKMMGHAPGLTALLQLDGRDLIRTDTTWKWNDSNRFRQCKASWADLTDRLVDARVEDGDWTQTGYVDGAWKLAVGIPGSSWGSLTARRIPLLRETPVALTLANGASLPVTLKAGEKLEFQTGRIVQAYPVIEFTAEKDTELSIEPFGVKYVAKAGPQSHFTIDTRGITKGAILVKSGTATITGLKLIERLYPFDQVGSFNCNDPFLNQLWTLCARSCAVLSEDAYVDCADRERVEWMDCDPPGFDITRTAMAGPGDKPLYADPRLLGAMVRRTALTLQPDGWVKAHTCSDRYDKHAKMEDRACEWVNGIRRYYDATGNPELVREIWPAVVAQMNYFLERRTARGLVLAREWVVWGNPVGYITLEGAGLNAWVYKALVDAAALGRAVGDPSQAGKFEEAAKDLSTAFNRELWNESEGTFYSGYSEPAKNAAAEKNGGPGIGPLKLKKTGNLVEPTVYPAIFALDRGIVSPEHRPRVLKYLMEHRDLEGRMMIYYYLHKVLYAVDSQDCDKEVLDCYRKRWQGMVQSPAQCSWEMLDGRKSGSIAHCYGMFPGYFLSAYVLGVRRDEPVAEKQLWIEPHLGDLTQAEGTVVTEFGPVPVSWKKNGEDLMLQITTPQGATTTLALPLKPGRDDFKLDGTIQKGRIQGSRLVSTLPPGTHQVIY